ncbi:MAG: hypothetical protein ACRD1R_16830 [Acidobacteriota bacterium]
MLDTLIVIYFGIWILMVAGTLFFFWGRNPAFKKKWHRPVGIINGIVIGGLLILIAVAMKVPWQFLVFFVAAATLIEYFMLVKIRVCGECGRTVQPQRLVDTPKYCPRCGAALDGEHARSGGEDPRRRGVSRNWR